MRHARTSAITLMFAGISAGIVAPLGLAAAEESRPPAGSVQEVLQRIELPDLDGENVQLSGLLGRGPVLLDFWATWCKPCLQAMPELQELYEDLAPRGLQVVGINEDGPRNASKVKPFLKTNGYTFPVLLDLNREAQRQLQALALPTTLVLDARGVVLHTSFGYRPGEFDKLRVLLEPHLDPKPDE